MLARELRELAELRARLEEKERFLDALPVDVASRLASMEIQLATLDAELRQLRAGEHRDMWELGNRLVEVERRLSSLEEGAEASRIRMRLERIGHRVSALEKGSTSIERRMSCLEEGPEITRIRMRLDRIGHRVDALDVDDLTAIRGVGPHYAEQLRAMGVSTFAELGGWSVGDVVRATVRLGVPASRIRDWVAAASERCSST